MAPDEAYVGLVNLTQDRSSSSFGCDFLGVARSYRNLGIATALLVLALQIAQRLGGENLHAGGGGIDTPFLRVVRKVGFEIEPAWVTFVRRR